MAVSQSIENLPTLPTVKDIEFRHVAGAPGYAVGDDGSVWSCLTKTGFGLWGYGEWRAKKTRRWGRYIAVGLYVGGKRRQATVHRLVLEAFYGACPDGCEALHADGDPCNNRLCNLSWGTPAENADDRDRHNRTAKGEKNGCAILKPQDVEQIRFLAARGMRQYDIAEVYGVHKSTVSLIVCRKKWKHV